MFGTLVCLFILLVLGYFVFALVMEVVYHRERKALETDVNYQLTELTALKR